MPNPAISLPPSGTGRGLELARVLVVHGELTPRLALQTILQAAGYFVDVAATSAEALAKLDESQYALVISDTGAGTPLAGRNVLAYARVKDYRPATALVTSSGAPRSHAAGRGSDRISVHTENVPTLLGEVAELIGLRASRRRARRYSANKPVRVA